jgi:DNA polymerase
MNLPTDRLGDFCFFDFETRALPGCPAGDDDVTTAGSARYAKSSFATILSYAIGGSKVRDVAWDGRPGWRMRWADLPLEFRQFFDYSMYDTGWFAAWNTAFDRAVWNHGTADFPPLPVNRTIDVMAQAVASNLPASLEGASRALGREGKQADGKALIKLFTPSDGDTPLTRPMEWALFRSYAIQDTDELREVWQGTRKLTPEEWHQYHVSERINARGMGIDLPFVERAAAVAEATLLRTNAQLPGLTGRAVTKVTQAKRIADWCFDRLDAKGRDMLTKAWELPEDGEDDGGELQPAKLSVSRDRIAAVLTYLKAKNEEAGLTDQEEAVYTVLALREFGGSNTPQKFSKMLAQHDEGRLKNQYVFNGAQQTGRFSSRGVQVHNLTRDTLGDSQEPEAINMINQLKETDNG